MLPATKRGRPSAAYSSAIRRASLSGGDIEVGGHASLAPLLEAGTRCLEGAGLDDVAPGLEETPVHALDDLGRVDGETVHPSFQGGATEIVDAGVLRLQAGPHRAVENEHTLA